MFKSVIEVSVATGPTGVNSLAQVWRLSDGAANGGETLPMDWAGAMRCESLGVRGCSVAFVLGKTIDGIGGVHLS